MNAMGHDVPTMIGVDQTLVQKHIKSLVPEYMAMGEKGMADMGEMEMPLPDNTLPMMSGYGQFGAVEMGGMFTAVKVRKDLAKNDYRDPGHYQNPPGTVAREVETDIPPIERQKYTPSKEGLDIKVRKPATHKH